MNKKVKHNYYVKNKDIMEEIWKLKETGVISEKLGEYIILIVEGLGRKPNFYAYPYKEEMISQAYCTIVKGIKNFDPDKQKYPNPFAYITKIAWNAFLQVINKEKRNLKILDTLCERQEEILKEVDKESPTIDYEKYSKKYNKK